LNGDGNPDLVVANFFGSDQGVAVLLGNGDGTFRTAVTYSSGGAFAGSVAIADVNGDGRPDLVVGNACAIFSNNACLYGDESGVDVLLGNGDGTFQAPLTFLSGGSFLQFVAVADVDGDGRPDLLAVNLCAFPNAKKCSRTMHNGTVGVLLGNGDGTFQPASILDSGGQEPTSIAVGDLSGDGTLDLVVANSGSSTVGVLLGNGSGGFQKAVTYFANFVSSATVADVNADGKLDLVVANASSNGDGTAGVLLGNGDGTFRPIATYSSGGQQTSSIAVADVDGDGKADLLVVNSGTGTIGALLGNGDGTFQAALTYDSGGGGYLIAVADVNGDSRPDLLVADLDANAVGVLLNDSAPHNPTATSLVSSRNPSLVGQAVTFTATVSSTAGTPPNGEIVTFSSGTAVLGTVPLSGGSASLTTSSLPLGASTITASYPGDVSLAASTSPGLKQVVKRPGKSATSTTLSSSLNPSIYGQAVTWTATVTSSGSIAPTGTVKFTWSDYRIGSATLNSNGVAAFTRADLNADPYPLTAVYFGDAANLGSTSAVLDQLVLETTSTATITSSPNPSTQGQAVTFTARISSPTVAAKGPVTFTAGKTVLGTAQLNGGKAKLIVSTLPVGWTKVRVTYYGDSNIAESLAVVTQKVQP
jgi:hypothetical protein